MVFICNISVILCLLKRVGLLNETFEMGKTAIILKLKNKKKSLVFYRLCGCQAHTLIIIKHLGKDGTFLYKGLNLIVVIR